MRTALAAFVAAAQLATLAYMAVTREWIVRTGATVWLRTAPVDPRDAFRGDYVRLDYQVGHVKTNLCRDLPAPARWSARRETQVYARLGLRGDGTAVVDALSTEPPLEGLYMRGWAGAGYRGHTVPVRYGIEAYFVEQGQGIEIERLRQRNGVQVPLEMKVAVGASGTAVLKGHRWGPLGMGLQLQADTNRLTRSVTVTLQNVSGAALTVVDLPGHASFRLVADEMREWVDNNWTWVRADRPRPTPRPEDLRLLKPGETWSTSIDLTDPDWYVVKPGEGPKAVSQVGWSGWFRLVYASPTERDCAGLSPLAPVWHGELMSRAFGGGRVD